MDLDSAWTWIKIHGLGLSLRDTLEIQEKDPRYCFTCTDIVTFLETWIWTLHGLGLRFTDLRLSLRDTLEKGLEILVYLY